MNEEEETLTKIIILITELTVAVHQLADRVIALEEKIK